MGLIRDIAISAAVEVASSLSRRGEKQGSVGVPVSGGASLSELLGGRAGSGRRSQGELLAAFGELPWLNAVVGRVSTSMAAVPWRVYKPVGGASRRAVAAIRRDVQKGGLSDGARAKAIARMKAAGELREIEDHPLLDLLYGGNPFHVGLSVRELTQGHLDVVGEAVWLFERDGLGMPVEILPIVPTWIRRDATPDNPSYEVEFQGWRGVIPASEIVHFRRPNLANPYGRGVGTANALNDELATDEAAAKHTSSWFWNKARPDLLVVGEGMSEDSAKRLERKWLAEHAGFRNAYKPAFLGAGGNVTVKELSQSFKNMELVELRKHERDTIVQVYGVPPEILGIIQNSNRATIEAADYLFARWVLVPRLEFQAAVLQERVVPEFDENLVIGYDSPVAADKEHEKAVMGQHPYAFTVDEMREAAGLEPLADGQGQVFMMPFNLVPQSSPSLLPAAPPEPAAEPVEEGRKATAKDEENESPLTLADVARIVAALSGEAMLRLFRTLLRLVIADFGEGALGEVDPDAVFDVENPRVAEFLEEHAGERIELVTDTTREALRRELSEGVREGEGIAELSARVAGVFGEARGNRSETIARTEVVGASNFGALEGYRQGGVPEKEWLATQDGRQRHTHDVLDGQRRALEDDFDSGSGAKGPCPGMLGRADEDIECRCAILPIIRVEEESGEETRAAVWRALDRERLPHERAVKQAARKSFTEQEEIVLGLIEAYAREAV